MASEKSVNETQGPVTEVDFTEVHGNRLTRLWGRIEHLHGVEQHGSEPVAAEEQTDRRYINLVTLWFSMNFNLIA